MRIPLGAERLFVTDPARLRWLHATDARLVPWPDPPPLCTRPLLTYGLVSVREAVGDKRNADGSPNFAYLDAGRWWETQAGVLGTGWVRNERFGSGTVIAGTNRSAQRSRK